MVQEPDFEQGYQKVLISDHILLQELSPAYAIAFRKRKWNKHSAETMRLSQVICLFLSHSTAWICTD